MSDLHQTLSKTGIQQATIYGC